MAFQSLHREGRRQCPPGPGALGVRSLNRLVRLPVSDVDRQGVWGGHSRGPWGVGFLAVAPRTLRPPVTHPVWGDREWSGVHRWDEAAGPSRLRVEFRGPGVTRGRAQVVTGQFLVSAKSLHSQDSFSSYGRVRSLKPLTKEGLIRFSLELSRFSNPTLWTICRAKPFSVCQATLKVLRLTTASVCDA